MVFSPQSCNKSITSQYPTLTSRYQPRAGPDGGDGGRGGSVILIADYSVKEFAHLPKHIKAENGGAGKADDCKGKNGSDQMWQVNYKLIGSQT